MKKSRVILLYHFKISLELSKLEINIEVLNPSCLLHFSIQWGSENRPFENRKHSKTGLFEVRFSNGGTIRKPDNLSGFQMVWT